MSNGIPELRNRHFNLMDAMILHPEMNQNELAELLNYSPSRFSIIVNSPLFKLAFAEYRRKHEANISSLAVEASSAALRFSMGILEDKEVPVPIRQLSARDILSQGHAKAIERRAEMKLEGEIPKEFFESLSGVAKELGVEFKPTRLLQRPDEGGEN